jgi:hypothetical protein
MICSAIVELYIPFQKPDQLAVDIRGFFRPLRPAPTNGSATSSTTKEI